MMEKIRGRYTEVAQSHPMLIGGVAVGGIGLALYFIAGPIFGAIRDAGRAVIKPIKTDVLMHPNRLAPGELGMNMIPVTFAVAYPKEGNAMMFVNMGTMRAFHGLDELVVALRANHWGNVVLNIALNDYARPELLDASVRTLRSLGFQVTVTD